MSLQQFTLAALLLFSSNIASSDDGWLLVATTPAGDRLFVDRTLHRVNGPWRVTFDRFVPTKPVLYRGKSIQASITLLELNCETSFAHVVQEIGYLPNGDVAYELTEPKSLILSRSSALERTRAAAVCSQAR